MIRLPTAPLFWVKFVGVLIALAGLVMLGFIVKGWKDDAALLELRTAERDQALADLEQRNADFAEVQEASNGYQTELAGLRSAAARQPPRVVRLCPLPADPKPARLSIAERGPAEAGPAPGGVPPQDGQGDRQGPDIGPDLYAIADDADELAAQARGLQAYALACASR